MSRRPSYFDRLSIANPCPVDWSQMTGNQQVRYCSQCDKKVYDLSKMSREKAEAIVARFEGQLCARILRGDDGLIITEEETQGPKLINRRASPVASAVVSALLGLSGTAVAMTCSQSNENISAQSQAKADKSAKQPQSAPVSLAGTVLDPQNSIIANAKISLKNERTDEEITATSLEDGTFSFASLQSGSYALKVEVAGFVTHQEAGIVLGPYETRRMNVTMQAGALGGIVSISRPMPLRALYDTSERIVIARIGKMAAVKKEEENSLMKTAIEISTNLKGGDNKSTIYVYHWGWGEDRKFPGGYTTGDNLLLFLNRREGGGYETLEPIYGVKKLSEADMSIYEQRIKELAAITKNPKPDLTAIVEWLVQCALKPATRWEGTFELAQSARQLAQSSESIADKMADR